MHQCMVGKERRTLDTRTGGCILLGPTGPPDGIRSPGGGIGRRASLRCWWEKSLGGSSPLLGIHVDDPLAILAGVVVVPETAINRRPLETARST